jgi:hypothetical protein
VFEEVAGQGDLAGEIVFEGIEVDVFLVPEVEEAASNGGVESECPMCEVSVCLVSIPSLGTPDATTRVRLD